MGKRMGRIRRIQTDFFELLFKNQEKTKKIRVNLPNPPNPFSHRIAIVSQHSEIRNPQSEIVNVIVFGF
jgi:hypothetical protein